jgi:hypothetical protein
MKNEGVVEGADYILPVIVIVISVIIVAAMIILVFYANYQSTLLKLTNLNKAYLSLSEEYNNSLSKLSQLQGRNANLSATYNRTLAELQVHANTLFFGTFHIPAYNATLNGTLTPGSYNISFTAPSAGYLVFNLTLTPPPNTTGTSIFYISSRKYYLQLLGRWLFATSAANTTGFSVLYQNATARKIAPSYTVINQTPFYALYPVLEGTSKIEFFTLTSNGSTVSGTITYYGHN